MGGDFWLPFTVYRRARLGCRRQIDRNESRRNDFLIHLLIFTCVFVFVAFQPFYSNYSFKLLKTFLFFFYFVRDDLETVSIHRVLRVFPVSSRVQNTRCRHIVRISRRRQRAEETRTPRSTTCDYRIIVDPFARSSIRAYVASRFCGISILKITPASP